MAEAKKQTKEEALKEAFAMTDIENKTWFQATRLGGALRSVGLRITDAQVAEYQIAAGGEEGQVDFAKFKEYVEKAQKEEKTHAEITHAFEVFAIKHDGKATDKVNVKELIGHLTALGNKMTPKQVQQFLDKTELEGEGFDQTVSLSAFLATVKKHSLEVFAS